MVPHGAENGRYGFNPGSTLTMKSGSDGALAAQVAMNTTLAAATGGITVFLLRYVITHKYDVGALCNGILAGLVSITAGCGNMESGSAVATGLIGGGGGPCGWGKTHEDLVPHITCIPYIG